MGKMMTGEMSQPRVIRDKAFAKRLETACENHPRSPSGHGRQKWVRERLQETCNVKVSPEAVRKWFAGEARPRPAVMKDLARVLEVDEAWLSLGRMPDMMPREQKKHNAVSNGSVNLLAGIIQINGGTIAFPDGDDAVADLYAIIRGKQYSINVKSAHTERDGTLKFSLPANTANIVHVGVVPTDEQMRFNLVRLPQDIVDKYGRKRGGYVELKVEHSLDSFRVDGAELPLINRLEDLVA